MSKKNFACFTLGPRLYVTTPIRHAVVGGRDVSWLTQFMFLLLPRDGAFGMTGSRWTRLCTLRKDGPRQLIREHPLTTTTIDASRVTYPIMMPDRLITTHETSWRTYERGRRYAGTRRKGRILGTNQRGYAKLRKVVDAPFAFNPVDILPLRDAAIETRVGQPLLDYLADDDTFGPLIHGPGWLPATWEEMRAREREAAAIHANTEPVFTADAAETEGEEIEGERVVDDNDRWR